LNLDRLPSKSEVKFIVGNESLANAITRHGGWKYFSEKLNLPMKKSCSSFGDENEDYILNLLIEMGYDAIKTKPRHPYDILVNGIVKIDVKSSHSIPSKVYMMDEFVFSINNTQPKCDIFIFIKVFDNKKDIFVIPSHFIKQSQLGIGENSKYDKYKNRFDYIETYVDLFSKVG
jgi:hypothetical protein